MGSFANSNDYLDGRKPVPTAESGHTVLATRFTIALGTGDLDANDIGAVGILPAGHVPVDVRVDGSDMDSGAAAAVFQVGVGNLEDQDAAGAASSDAKDTLISTVAADGGGAWGDTGAAVATAFDKALTRTLNNMNAVTAVDYDRHIVVKVTTAPTTAVAGTLGLTLFYRPK